MLGEHPCQGDSHAFPAGEGPSTAIERARLRYREAAALFAERGLGATKITDIAEAAGISQGLLYHYYPSKEAIYVELIRAALVREELIAIGPKDWWTLL